jgi:uncharacterized surface protein with fasciclin (FAS1) repeats
MIRTRFLLTLATATLAACAAPQDAADSAPADAPATATGGEAAIVDSTSEPHIAKIAAGSPDHATLVTALKAAGLVDVLGTSGPFTVFAPVNAAFDALPPGTVESLVRPESKEKLTAILHHHVTTSALAIDAFTDGRTMTMVDGTPVTISRQGDVVTVSGARIVTSIRASNGWVHVIDKVLLPGS